MHYLSRYQLSTHDSRILGITDTYSIHSIIYDLFSAPKKEDQSSRNILFADKGVSQGVRTILVCSSYRPKPPKLGQIQTKEINQSYLKHHEYFFEITVNPVKRCSSSRKIIPILGYDEVAEWFKNKSNSHGFNVKKLETKNYYVDFFKKNYSQTLVTIAKCTLIGVLQVTDFDQFSHSVLNGIGRAKSFGCGLLQIVPFN